MPIQYCTLRQVYTVYLARFSPHHFSLYNPHHVHSATLNTSLLRSYIEQYSTISDDFRLLHLVRVITTSIVNKGQNFPHNTSPVFFINTGKM